MGPPDPTPRWLDLGGRVPVADERVADCWVGWGWAREPRPPARSGGDRDDPSPPESAGLGHPWPLSFLSILHWYHLVPSRRTRTLTTATAPLGVLGTGVHTGGLPHFKVKLLRVICAHPSLSWGELGFPLGPRGGERA
jgi:hypothetical protein